MTNPFEINLKITFNNPDLISSASPDPDLMNVIFVSTESFLKCKDPFAYLDEPKDERQLQSLEVDRNSIPPGFPVRVSLPP